MKITVKKDRWKLHDIFSILAVIQIDDYEEKYFKMFKVKIDKDLVHLFEKFKKKVDIHSSSLKLFLSEDNYIRNLPCDADLLWEFDDIDELPALLRGQNYDEVKYQTIKNIYIDHVEDGKEIDKKHLTEISQDTGLIFEFVNKLDINKEFKWELFSFFSHPERYFEEFAGIVESILPLYKSEMQRYESKMNKFHKFLQHKVDNNALDFFNDLNGIFNMQSYKEIRIIGSIIDQSIGILNLKDVVYLILGENFENTFVNIRGANDIDINLNIVNILSDPIKQKIIQCIKEKEAFGREICEYTGLSKASLSYHVDDLLLNNVVKTEKKGNRLYYSLKTEVVVNALQSLLNYFS